MTGGPGLDWEDTSSNDEWRRATEGRWTRAFTGMIKIEDVGASPGLVRRPESSRTGPCVRPPESAGLQVV